MRQIIYNLYFMLQITELKSVSGPIKLKESFVAKFSDNNSISEYELHINHEVKLFKPIFFPFYRTQVSWSDLCVWFVSN